MNKLGKVFLVGSGPGDLDLLTIKAYKTLQRADVVIYDRLINSDILDICPAQCARIYVGKQEGYHSLDQSKINELLVTSSRKYKNVVRLKGGDPFVFGRGGEEIETLVQYSVPFEVVPGISSSIAAATYSGIPVTHRGVSNNFTVVTGNSCSQQGLDHLEWESLSKAGTLVILMGVRNRQLIAENLLRVGKGANVPVAFIENATTPSHRVIVTNLQKLLENPPEVSSPAVMIVGEVVNFHHEWNWFLPSLEEKLKEESVEQRIPSSKFA